MENIGIQALARAKNAVIFEQKCSKHGLKMYTYKNHVGEQVTCCLQCQVEAMEVLQERFEQEARKSIVERKFRENSLVNSKMWKCTFDTFKTQPGSKEEYIKGQVRNAAISFAKKPVAHHVLLYGKPGAGKSHLAMAMMQEIHKHRPAKKMAFINISRLFSRIKNSFEDPTEYWTRKKALQIMTGVDLLCIDDLGTESSMGHTGQEATKWAQEVIYEVLENQDRIIITTNLSEEDLKQVYDDKIFSRIFAHSQNTRFDFTGITDKRLIGA